MRPLIPPPNTCLVLGPSCSSCAGITEICSALGVSLQLCFAKFEGFTVTAFPKTPCPEAERWLLANSVNQVAACSGGRRAGGEPLLPALLLLCCLLVLESAQLQQDLSCPLDRSLSGLWEYVSSIHQHDIPRDNALGGNGC